MIWNVKNNTIEKEPKRMVDIEFLPLKQGGFKAVKYLKTSYGMLTVAIFKGAQYTDKPGLFMVEMIAANKRKEPIILDNLTEYELTHLINLLTKL